MISLEDLGDQGFLARFADEAAASAWAEAVRGLAPPWLLDVVQAYTIVAVFHDPVVALMSAVRRALAGVTPGSGAEATGRRHVIPCCYEMGPDLEEVAGHLALSPDEVVRLHHGREYTVYAVGFSPGFPYLGYLDDALAGVPRRGSPRLRVEPGSVGLTGRQTGIYPEARPGGWNLVGRTPLTLVDVAAGYFPLRTGDRVRFEPIGQAEFAALASQGSELPAAAGRV